MSHIIFDDYVGTTHVGEVEEVFRGSDPDVIHNEMKTPRDGDAGKCGEQDSGESEDHSYGQSFAGHGFLL